MLLHLPATLHTSKNGIYNEVISHGQSNHPHCCHVRATVCLICYHQLRNTPHDKPLASYHYCTCLINVKIEDITEQIKAAAMTQHSATLHWAGSAMALVCMDVNFNIIKNDRSLAQWLHDSISPSPSSAHISTTCLLDDQSRHVQFSPNWYRKL